MALNPGARLAGYEIVRLLGAGGMGAVYQATDTRVGRTVAIKVLPAHVADDPIFRQRFEREAQALAALHDPHISAVFDIGRQDDIDFVAVRRARADGASPGRTALSDLSERDDD
jgi:serine/threonine-protein kinase